MCHCNCDCAIVIVPLWLRVFLIVDSYALCIGIVIISYELVTVLLHSYSVTVACLEAFSPYFIISSSHYTHAILMP